MRLFIFISLPLKSFNISAENKREIKFMLAVKWCRLYGHKGLSAKMSIHFSYFIAPLVYVYLIELENRVKLRNEGISSNSQVSGQIIRFETADIASAL